MIELTPADLPDALASMGGAAAVVKRPWEDKPDQFSDRVKAAHPVMCDDADRHARYALAMEMIHSRHSKYALVDLVNWLLTKWPELQTEAKR